jgi:hypothetical protein
MYTVLQLLCGKLYNLMILLNRELLHEQVPFDNDINLAKNFVVTEHARPEISESVDENLAKMIRMCWLHNPDQRPNFTYIFSKLK